MKFRMDFVTNSSSSGFMATLQVELQNGKNFGVSNEEFGNWERGDYNHEDNLLTQSWSRVNTVEDLLGFLNFLSSYDIQEELAEDLTKEEYDDEEEAFDEDDDFEEEDEYYIRKLKEGADFSQYSQTHLEEDDTVFHQFMEEIQEHVKNLDDVKLVQLSWGESLWGESLSEDTYDELEEEGWFEDGFYQISCLEPYTTMVFSLPERKIEISDLFFIDSEYGKRVTGTRWLYGADGKMIRKETIDETGEIDFPI